MATTACPPGHPSDSWARRRAQAAMPATCAQTAQLAKKRQNLLAELGRCADLDALGAVDGDKSLCRGRAADKADDLLRTGQKAAAAGDRTGAQRAFDRA